MQASKSPLIFKLLANVLFLLGISLLVMKSAFDRLQSLTAKAAQYLQRKVSPNNRYRAGREILRAYKDAFLALSMICYGISVAIGFLSCGINLYCSWYDKTYPTDLEEHQLIEDMEVAMGKLKVVDSDSLSDKLSPHGLEVVEMKMKMVKQVQAKAKLGPLFGRSIKMESHVDIMDLVVVSLDEGDDSLWLQPDEEQEFCI